MMKTALVASSIGVALGWSAIRNAQLPMGPSRMHWGGVVFGHRGCRGVPGIPENTLDAFKYALSRGCGGVECDVRLTKDNELVIFHDAFAGGALRNVPPAKRVDEFTLFELKECTYAEDPTEQIRVPTLEESVLFCRENGIKMLIEIKELRRPALCTDKVLELYRRYPDYMYENTTLISFNPSALYHARQRDRGVAVGQIYSTTFVRSLVSDGIETAPLLARLFPSLASRLLLFVQSRVSPWVTGCSVVCPRFSMYTEDARHRWHSRRIAVYLWGFADSAECTGEMRRPGVFVAADDKHEEYATAAPPPDFDIFGDRQREREREEEEQRKRLKLNK